MSTWEDVMTTGYVERLCFPDGFIRAGKKWRACCHCGFVTTPRVSRERATEALDVEHGRTAGRCAICEIETEMFCGQEPWAQFRPLVDGDHEVYVCRDDKACHERYQANEAARRLKCGCDEAFVQAIGHYHEWRRP